MTVANAGSYTSSITLDTATGTAMEHGKRNTASRDVDNALEFCATACQHNADRSIPLRSTLRSSASIASNNSSMRDSTISQ